jgi:glycosyltransferase involved in cell wall biosynthesis
MHGTNMNPLVSVVIATYNMATFLPASVRSVLAQTYAPLEAIVVDDGSTDDTAEVVRPFLDDPRVRYVHQPNGGQRAAKNAGIRAARGEYVAFNDADDLWYPHKLQKQIPLFDADGRVGMVYAERDLIDERGNPAVGRKIARFRGANLYRQLLLNNFVPFSTCVISRHCFERLGIFDDRMERSIDYELWLRYSLHYEFDYVNEPLAAHRVWAGQMSNDKRRRYEAAFQIQDAFLRQHPGLVDRRRVGEAWAAKYVGRGRSSARQRRWWDAGIDFLRAIRHSPGHLPAYKSLLKLVLRKA